MGALHRNDNKEKGKGATLLIKTVTAFAVATVFGLGSVFGISSVANAADAVPPVDTTQAVVTKVASPALDPASVVATAAPKTEAPSSDAIQAPKTEAPAPAPAKTTVPTVQSTQPAEATKVKTDTLPAPPTSHKSDPAASPAPVAPPVAQPCTNKAVTWTRDAHLSTVTVTLNPGYAPCDVSLNSYETQGANWETSGTQRFVDHANAHLTKEHPTVTLNVKVEGCFQQQDLYHGTTRYDGTDGALPHFPNSSTPAGLIDHWNGAVACTPPPVIKPVATISSGACYYNPDLERSFKPISLTFDNTTSNVPVEFVVSAPHGDLSRTVPAGKSVTVQAQDGPQGGIKYGVTAGGKTFELNIPAFEQCLPSTDVRLVNVKFTDSTVCNVPGTYSIEGATLNPEGTRIDLKTGTLYTEQDIKKGTNEGTYYITDVVTTADGVRFITADFYLAGAYRIAEPGPNDTYWVISDGGQTYAEWTHRFPKVEVCPTKPPVVTPPVTPPVVTPPATPPVVTPPVVTPPPTTTAATMTVKKTGSLASTGADVGAGGLIGLLLLLAGIGSVVFAKFRPRKVAK